MKNRKNILFITWDGPQTNYTEGLFMPIFHMIEKISPQYKFFYLQFTWGNDQSQQIKASKKYNIPYKSVSISRGIIPQIGSLLSLFNGSKHIKKYVEKWDINILMPRSNYPAFMTMKSHLKLPIIFDADGLPIEERVDFTELKQKSFLYKFLKKIEKKALLNSEIVLTRSYKSIEHHLQNHLNLDKTKFHVVTNGRNIHDFQINENNRKIFRANLEIPQDATVFLYAGSFGPQYGWNEMINIFKSYLNTNSNSYFLFLTGSPEKVKNLIPKSLEDFFILKRVPFDKIPQYFSTADIAFAIREPKYSMKGVAPIKLGEYLLCGIPTIASEGIGDSREILTRINGTYLYNHDKKINKQEIIQFINDTRKISKLKIRNSAIEFFSLENSAKSYIDAFETL